MSIHMRFMPKRIAVGVLASLLSNAGGYALAQGEGAAGGPTETGNHGKSGSTPPGDPGVTPSDAGMPIPGPVDAGASNTGSRDGGLSQVLPPDGGINPSVAQKSAEKRRGNHSGKGSGKTRELHRR